MRIFIAGASGDREKIRDLIQALPQHGCSGYNWTTHPGYEDAAKIDPLRTAGESYQQIQIAEALILHVSEKPSPGATGETMLALMAGFPIALLVDVPGTIYGPECYAKRRQDLIPVENIWAHWFAAHFPTVGNLEEALGAVGVPVVVAG